MDIHDRIRDWWELDAAVYDGAPGHALSDPVEAAAWSAALRALLPPPGVRVLDVGAGTGAMSLLAAELGHAVTGFDVSERMLEVARRKATDRGLDIAFLHIPDGTLPEGPFDAIVERHVAWTLPDPVAALRAWRSACAPDGTLILFEGSWGGEGPGIPVRDRAAGLLERLHGIPDHHHAPYPPEVLAGLPLAGLSTPAPFVRAVDEAGWTRIRLYRLRDVEWAIERRQPWPLGWLTHRPRYAVVAQAPGD
jgi:SAM-dependent methyltransferase